LSRTRLRETMSAHWGTCVRPEVPPTRVSGQRRRAPEADNGTAVQEGHVWSASSANARHAHGLALLSVRNAASCGRRCNRQMSEVRLRTALLPAVHSFRYLRPLRMRAAHSGANSAQRRAQPVHLLLHAGSGGKGNFHTGCGTSARRPPGLRKPLQEVDGSSSSGTAILGCAAVRQPPAQSKSRLSQTVLLECPYSRR